MDTMHVVATSMANPEAFFITVEYERDDDWCDSTHFCALLCCPTTAYLIERWVKALTPIKWITGEKLETITTEKITGGLVRAKTEADLTRFKFRVRVQGRGHARKRPTKTAIGMEKGYRIPQSAVLPKTQAKRVGRR